MAQTLLLMVPNLCFIISGSSAGSGAEAFTLPSPLRDGACSCGAASAMQPILALNERPKGTIFKNFRKIWNQQSFIKHLFWRFQGVFWYQILRLELGFLLVLFSSKTIFSRGVMAKNAILKKKTLKFFHILCI